MSTNISKQKRDDLLAKGVGFKSEESVAIQILP